MAISFRYARARGTWPDGWFVDEFPVAMLRLFSNNGYTRLATSANFSVSTAKVFFIHPDHLDTPRQVYDDQQQIRWKWDQFEPFSVHAALKVAASSGVPQTDSTTSVG